MSNYMMAKDAAGVDVYDLQFSGGGLLSFVCIAVDLFALYGMTWDGEDAASGVADRARAVRALAEVLAFAVAALAEVPEPTPERAAIAADLTELVRRSGAEPDTVSTEEISAVFDALEALEPTDLHLAARFEGSLTMSRFGAVACFANEVCAAARRGPVSLRFVA